LEKLKVNELFWSAQGEGTHTGIPSIFLRLTGCSLGCSYCDSKSAWHDGDYLAIESIIKRIMELRDIYPGSQVVITGGEPLEQNIDTLVRTLKEIGFFIALETNGDHYRNIPIDWWAVSPKDVNDFRIHERLWDRISEIKLIVNDNLSFDIIKIISKKRMDIPVFLQPQFPDPGRFESTYNLYDECIRRGLGNVRLGIQMHRNYGIR